MSRLLCLVALACLVIATAGLSVPKKRKPVCGWAPKAKAKYEKLDPFYSPSQFKVLNGEVPTEHIFPFTVSLSVKGSKQTFCTGSIIGSKYILTAAHCYYIFTEAPGFTKKGFLNAIYVTYGAVATNESIHAAVEDFIFTPGSKQGDYDDIMIVKLKKEINFTADVSPVCLTPDIPLDTGKMLIVSGYGNHSTGPNTYHKMSQYVVDTIPVVDMRECGYFPPRQKKHSFCAGGIEKGTMIGDSGGPMYAIHKGNFYQVGVVALGATQTYFLSGKQIREDYAYYTKSGNFCDFIKKATQDDVECRTLK